MLKTDYIKAFTEAIEEADLENDTVIRNLDNALVMASAKYEVNDCVNVEGLTSNGKWELTDPVFNFGINRYRLKPEPQYKPFDVESFKPYRDCWFKLNNSDLMVKAANYFDNGITFTMYQDTTLPYSWEYFMENFTIDGKPAGVEVCID